MSSPIRLRRPGAERSSRSEKRDHPINDLQAALTHPRSTPSTSLAALRTMPSHRTRTPMEPPRTGAAPKPDQDRIAAGANHDGPRLSRLNLPTALDNTQRRPSIARVKATPPWWRDPTRTSTRSRLEPSAPPSTGSRTPASTGPARSRSTRPSPPSASTPPASSASIPRSSTSTAGDRARASHRHVGRPHRGHAGPPPRRARRR